MAKGCRTTHSREPAWHLSQLHQHAEQRYVCLMQITTAAMSSGAQRLCHVQKTLILSRPCHLFVQGQMYDKVTNFNRKF